MSDNRYNGILAAYKPSGISSHKFVQNVRKICDFGPVGHTGTLDPAAEGLLVLCMGRATKLAGYISDSDKSYRAVVRLGLASESYDSETVTTEDTPNPVPTLHKRDISAVLRRFVGTIKQRVPPFSAVQVNGQRLYKMARKGEEIVPPEREVRLNRLTIVSYEEPDITIDIECGKGTYIRSLAHDIGEAIGCGAHLASLRRTAVGEIRASEALTLDEIEKRHTDNRLEDAFLPVEKVLGLRSIVIAERFKHSLSNGRQPTPSDVVRHDSDIKEGDRVLLRDSQGRVLAIGRAKARSAQMLNNATAPVVDFDRVLI